MNEKDLELQIRAKNLTADAFAKISEAMKALEDQSGQTSKKTQLSFSQIATGIGIAAGTVAALSAGLVTLGTRGADIGDVKDHFKTLTSAIGENADVMLGKLRAGTLNTISDFDLMKIVNKDLSLGLKLTSDQMGLVAKTAQALADRTGGDTKEAFEALMGAMATGKDKLATQVGLNIDAAKAQKAYADSIGKTVGELDENEKRTATMNAILDESRKIVNASGEAQADFGEKISQNKTKVTNFVDGIAEWVSQSPLIEHFSGTVTVASGAIGAFGLAAGPVKDGVDKLLPMLGVSGGLSGGFSTLGKGITTFLTGPWGMAAAAFAGGLAIGALIRQFTDVDKWLDGLLQKKGMLERDKQTAGAAQDTINAAIARGAAATINYAEAIKYNVEWSQKHAAQLKIVTDGQQQQQAATEKAKAAQEALTAARKLATDTDIKFRKEMDFLGVSGRATVKQLLDQGHSVQEVAASYRGLVSEGTISHYKDQLQEETQAAKESAAAHAELVQQMLATNHARVGAAQDAITKSTSWMKAPAFKLGTNKLDLVATFGGQYSSLAPGTIQGTRTQAASFLGAGMNSLGMAGPAHLGAKTFDSGSMFGDIATQLPSTLMAAFTGGGNPIAAVGGLTGGKLGESLVTHFGKTITDNLGKTLGAGINTILPGLGTLVGPLIGKLGKLFGKSEESKTVNPLRDQFVDAAGGLEVLNAKVMQATGSLALIHQLQSAKTEQQYKAAVEGITKAVDGYDTKLKNAAASEELVAGKLEHIHAITPDLQAALEGAFNAKTPDEYSTALAGINGILDTQSAKQKELDATLKEFGISWTQTGTAAKEAHLAELTDELGHKFDVLSAGGVSLSDIMGGMKPRMTDFLVEARKAGVEVPESFQKVLQAAIDNGDLFDENGQQIKDMKETGLSFGTTMEQVTKDLNTTMRDLADVIKNVLGGAFTTVADTAIAALHRIPGRVPVEIDYRNKYDGGSGDEVPGAADGVFATRPMLRVFGEGGEPELGGPVDFMSRALAGAIAQNGGGTGGSGGDIYIAVDPNSGSARSLSQAEFQQIERGMNTGLIKIPQRAIGGRAR